MKPLPFLPEELEVFWKSEGFDDKLPSPGFITDLVTALRGRETPTITAAWTAVFTLASVMKRESFFMQYPSKIFPNFFILVVGPPRLVSKSFAVNYADEFLLMEYHNEIRDPVLRALKRANILRSRSTPEALSVALVPESETLFIDRKVKDVDRGSQLTLIISELAMFLGKQKYNQGMVTKLINLYDCKAFDDDVTISRGNQPMRNVYVTLFGATTRDQFEKTITEEALGQGFVSRIVIIHTNKPTRIFPTPQPVMGKGKEPIDWPDELRKRLAWIAENSFGEYTMEKSAQDFYDEWYLSNHKSLLRNIESRSTEIRSRLDVHLLKLSMVFRAQRYESGRIITLQDMKEAARFLLSTYDNALTTLEDAIAPGDFNKWMNRIVTILKDPARKGQVNRTTLLRQMSPYGCKKDDTNLILKQLNEEDRIAIKTPSGHPSLKAGNEMYIWKKGLQEGLR